MNLNRIMSNIYGVDSSQNFDNVMLGGNVLYAQPRFRYLDEVEEKQSSTSYIQSYQYNKLSDISNSYTKSLNGKGLFSYGFSGGKSFLGGAAKEEIVYDSPMYVKDSTLTDFIKSFYLYYHFTAGLKRNSVIIVPSSSQLEKLKKEFNSKLSGASIKPDTVEASKFAQKEALPYKHFIFDVYGSNENNKMPYRVDSNFPSTASSETLCRTNRLFEVYYFKFNGPKEILVSTSEKMDGACKLSLLAKCNNECFILEGDFPLSKALSKSSIYTVSSEVDEFKEDDGIDITISEAALSGGKKHRKKHHSKNLFLKLFNANQDADQAAYNLIGTLGLFAIEKGESADEVANKLSNYYSGDFVHCAMSLIAKELAGEPVVEINNSIPKYSKHDIAKMHKYIINAYSPKKINIDMNKLKDITKQIYSKSKSLKSYSDKCKSMLNNIKKLYGSRENSVFEADIATALVKENNSYEGVKYAINIMQNMNDIFKDAPEYDSEIQKQSTFNAVYSVFSTTPFIGIHSKGFVPMLMNHSKHSVFSKKVSKSAFDDNLANEENHVFDFKLEDEDTGEKHDEVEIVVTPVDEEPSDVDKDFEAFY